MQENTNKAILLNSIILYVRLIIIAVTGLLVTRFALQALGVKDFGLFSVVGSIITFIAIINTVMMSTSNRFIAVAIGKGNDEEINEQFNVNLVIHVAIAIFILLIAFPLGDWYIHHYVNYDGDLNLVVKVFEITIIGSVISFVGVPYNGFLVAKERFFLFCITDIIVHLLKLGVTYTLIYYFTNKLFVYAFATTVLTALPTLVYLVYCRTHFRKLTKPRFIRVWKPYKEVLSFSVWVGFGAVAFVGKNQGSSLVINAFFNTVINAALGVANSVNAILHNLATNVTRAISPQITKSYAAGNYQRSESLVCKASKISFLFMFALSSPFLVAPDYIFTLWLKEVPDNVILFTNLLIIDALIGCFNAGIPDLIFASGRIKWYQIIVNSLSLLSVVAAFFVLKGGAPAYSLLVTYIVFSAIVLIVRQVILNKVVKFNNWRLIRESYIPSLLILLCFSPCFFLKGLLHPILLILISLVYLSILIYFMGLNKEEKSYIIIWLKKRLLKND